MMNAMQMPMNTNAMMPMMGMPMMMATMECEMLDDGMMCGYKAVASNQVSATLGGGSEHGIIFGNWSDALIGMWGGLELVVDPYSLKKQGMIEVTSFQMCDIALRHGESFCKATGATIA